MSFDRLARHYRWMEFILAGNKLQRCRTAFLDRVAGARNILIAGEGNGRFLVACRRATPAARITVLDSSVRMLDAARKRLINSGADASRVEFVRSDARDWTPLEESCDLIVTHFFLDCFPADQLEKVVASLAGSAMPAAAWLLSDFQVPTRGWRRQRAKAIHALMYAFFRVVTGIPATTLCPAGAFLERHGFVLKEKQASEWGLLHTDLWVRRPAPRNEQRSEDEVRTREPAFAFRATPPAPPWPFPAQPTGPIA